MQSDDDELYEPEEDSPQDTSEESIRAPSAPTGGGAKAEELEEGEEEGEDEEIDEDESESDVEFITEKKGTSKDEKSTFERPKPSPVRVNVASESAKALAPPVKTETPALSSSTPHKPGSEYPATHTSNIDVNADPVYGPAGKEITQIDLDADLGENDKPWRRPGTDITDYFNYGFDEFTWASYCLKQQSLRKEVTDQKKEMEDMQNFFGGGMPGLPGMPGATGPPGAPPAAGATPGQMGMPGMPELTPELMTSMMGAMYQQGLDPSTMQPDDFMRYAQQYIQAMNQAGAGQGQNQQQQTGGYGGFDQQQQQQQQPQPQPPQPQQQQQQQQQHRGGRGRGGRRW